MCANAMGRAEGAVPGAAPRGWQISEINFSEFPIIIVAAVGRRPGTHHDRLADEDADRARGAVRRSWRRALRARRDEMLEVILRSPRARGL